MIEELIQLYCQLSTAYALERGSGDLTVFVKPQIYAAIQNHAGIVDGFGRNGIYWLTGHGTLNFRISDHVQGEILTTELNELVDQDRSRVFRYAQYGEY